MKSVLGSPCGTSGALGNTRCSRLAKCSRKRVRISFPVTGSAISLRGEALDAPSARWRPPDVAQAIVEPIFSVFPELDPVRTQRVPSPIVRHGDLIGVLHGKFRDPVLEDLAGAHDVTLPRRQRGELGAAPP